MAWDTLFYDFPVERQYEWTVRADNWYEAHREHIDALIPTEKDSYPPSGSDCGRPELWKAGHWRWFFERR